MEGLKQTAEGKERKYMLVEKIRSFLGEDLASQVESALKGKGKDGKDIDLVIGNDGSFVPAEKYNGVNNGKNSAENILKAAAESLKTMGGSGDPEKIADDLKNVQETMNQLQSTHETEIKKIRKNAALQLTLQGKVHDPSDIIGLLDLDQIDVGDDGSLTTDIEPLLKPIRESKAYLFKEAESSSPTIKGAKSAEFVVSNQPHPVIDGPVIL